ncbi:MAG: TIGR04290 family methyltransferase [Desulfobacteraceae bacterium]|nr:MAG: TIGR04290 family methyltransferase [Desulfobacteraceae bacterium]
MVAELAPWFHNIHLPGGLQTAPEHVLGDFPANKWLRIRDHLPGDLRGWQALDIGCNAGFYSFALARLGAQVTAIDNNAHYLRQARWAAGQLNLSPSIHFEQMSVYALARTRRSFDLILFMGVFYHLRYPLLALDIVARKVKRRMVFQTLSLPGMEIFDTGEDRGLAERSDLLHPGWPKMAFIEHKMAGDPTNWWVANHAGVTAMLRSSGMRVIENPAEEIYICEPGGKNDWTSDFIDKGLRELFDPV